MSANTAVGVTALFAVTTGDNNVGLGAGAGASLTTGTSNVLVGNACGDALTTTSSNTAMGSSTLGSATGSNNTCIGNAAGFGVTTGGNNLFLGKDAGRTGAPGGNFTSQSNKICLGDSSIDAAHIQVSLTVASDKRDKTDVEPLKTGLNFINKLNPVTYRWDKRNKYTDLDNSLGEVIPDGTHKENWLDTGFLAQDVEVLETEYGYNIADKTNLTTTCSDDGLQYGLKYEKFVPMLVKAIQELSAKVDELQKQLNSKGE